MTNIIELARQAGAETQDGGEHFEFDDFDIFHFARLIRADERELCAKVCDVTPPYPFRPSIEAAHAIRARGQA